MKICTKCNKSLEDNMNFCPICGASLIEVTPLAKAEEEKPLAQEEPKKVGRGLKITALMFSIFGFFYGTIDILIVLMNLFLEYPVGKEYAYDMTFAFMIYCFPLALVGFILSLKAKRAEKTSKAAGLGKVFGLLGIIFMSVAFVIALDLFQNGGQIIL